MWLDDARRDLQYAVRMLRRAPAVAAVAILTIAPGIRANTAIFSILYAVLLPPGFHFPDDNTEFWAPLGLALPADGRARRVTMMARLADRVSPEAAADEIAAIVMEARGKPSIASVPRRFEVVRVQDEVGESVKPAFSCWRAPSDSSFSSPAPMWRISCSRGRPRGNARSPYGSPSEPVAAGSFANS